MGVFRWLGYIMHCTAGKYLCFIYIINSTENLFNKYVSIRAHMRRTTCKAHMACIGRATDTRIALSVA